MRIVTRVRIGLLGTVGLFMAAGLVATGEAADRQPTETGITVMSFNIRGDFDLGAATDKAEAWIAERGDHRRDRLLTLVKRHDPDLLGVQEAYANQADEIAQSLPDHRSYGVGRDDGHRRGEQCTIYWRASRFTAEDQGTLWLSEEPTVPGSQYPGAACPRIATWVRLHDIASDRSFQLINTHWDHVSAESRRFAAGRIQELISHSTPATPTIVMGDFNAKEGSAPLRRLLDPSARPALIDTYRTVHPQPAEQEATFHGFNGSPRGRRIDFILTTGAWRPTEAAIDHTDTAPHASDHFPVTATLQWR